MRRFVYLLLLVLCVGASATCVNASTDCERWFVAYRQELAHSRQVQRIAAVKRRAKLYAKQKIAQVQQKPAPKPKLVLARSPRMTRQQTLHHFNLACGVLPDGGGDEPLVSEETPGPFSAERPLNDSIDLLSTAPGELIAENEAPPAPGGYSPGVGPSVYTPGLGGGGVPSGGGPGKGVIAPPTPPLSGPPTGPPSGPPSGPPTGPPSGPPSGPPTGPPSGPPSGPPTGPPSGPPSGPPTGPPSGPPSGPPTGPPVTTPPPPVAVVPEPATYVYLLTGLAGAAGAIRRRFKV